MKILEHTPTRLLLDHEPVEQWLRGAAVTVGGLFLSVRVLYFVALHLNRGGSYSSEERQKTVIALEVKLGTKSSLE